MRLHIVRHADPDYERNTITPRGHQEAAALAPRIRDLDPVRLYSSPMGRARDTAEYTSLATGMPVTVLDWTAELAGPRVELLIGRSEPVWNLDGERIREHDQAAHGFSWAMIPELADPAIEALCAGVAQASDEFLAARGYRRTGGWYEVAAEADEGDHVVFCHAGFGMTWLAHLLGVPPPLLWCGIYLAPSSVTTVQFERRSARRAVPRALSIGDTSHIAVAGLTPNYQGLLQPGQPFSSSR